MPKTSPPRPCLTPVDGRLLPWEIGGGRVRRSPEGALPLPAAAAGTPPLIDHADLRIPPVRCYADAQLDDTQALARERFRWTPPLRFSVHARASIPNPLGTFGFGFWNDPFSLSLGMGGAGRKLPAAPQCAWFFYGSPPHDLALAQGVPGSGWKAQTLSFRPLPPLLLAPIAAGGALLAAFPRTRRWAFRRARRFYSAEERRLEVDPAAWHKYAIEWTATAVHFFVDDAEVLNAPRPPRPPLGLVLWIDNQYAVASPEKGFGFGVLPLEQEQSLELEDARIVMPFPA
ncbi:MAG: family 16 glycosylhydrolase [Anaerolineales bacterium]|nr:family 16 glycosylhydrolase [Anaerolineales bacterium]